MDNRTILAFALALALVPATSVAEPAVLSDADVRALARSLPQGPTFRSGGQTYRPVAGLRATVRGQATAVERMRSLGAADVDVVQEKGPYVIFRDATATTTATARQAAPGADATLPVVVNVRSGRLGVLDSTVVVKLKDVRSAPELAVANGLTLEFVAEGIRYAFLRVPPGRDVVAAAAAVARDPGVVLAEPEVRERFAVPM